MNPALGRVLMLAAALRGGWWLWAWVVLPWWQALDRYADALTRKGWATALGVTSADSAAVLAACLAQAQCRPMLLKYTAQVGLHPPPSAWLVVVVMVALLVIGHLLAAERSPALPVEPPGEALQRAVRLKRAR